MKILTKRDVKEHNDRVLGFNSCITNSAITACDIEDSLQNYVKNHEDVEELLELIERVRDIKENLIHAMIYSAALKF